MLYIFISIDNRVMLIVTCNVTPVRILINVHVYLHAGDYMYVHVPDHILAN